MTNMVRKEVVNTKSGRRIMNRAGMKHRCIRYSLYGFLALILLTGLPAAGHAGEEIVLVTYGDSLSAGLGLKEKDAFPAQLESALKKRGHEIRVVNSSVSGDTTAAGLKRFNWSFPKNAHGAILELGANDAMRGLKPGNARANLDEILKRMKAKGVEPLLTGMLAPRNLGVEYTAAFDAIYRDLAKKHGVLLYPFFLFDVVGKRELSLEDGLHPNPKGVARIVEQIVPVVEKLLSRIELRKQKAQ
jgi:acyl-CoA thioesterase-1